MATLQARTVRGHKYWYIVESRRINGKPRPVVLAYLGKAEQLLHRLQHPTPDSLRLKSYAHGAVAALLRLVQRLDLIPIINRHVPTQPSKTKQLRDGLTVGASLALRIIQRICAPCSNRAFADWAKTTSLDYLLKINTRKLDSQHFWEQMHCLTEQALQAIEQEVVARLLQTENIALDTLLLDATNFFTFIDTTNPHCPLAQRGKNKQGRNNLRQIGVLLVVSRADLIPLFHESYPGNKADSKVFAEVLPRILARLQALGCDKSQVTLVFDRGNNSKENLSAEKLKLPYVGALVPTQHKKLIDQAQHYLAHHPATPQRPLVCYRVKTKLWDQERTVVIYRSQELYDSQWRGVEKDLSKRCLQLAGLNQRLANRQSKKRTEAELTSEVKKLVKGPLLTGLLRWEIQACQTGWQVHYEQDAEAIQKLKERLGLRLLMSDRHAWSDEAIVAAYHSQATVEYGFRNLKNPYHIGLRPQYHWTEQKIRVHVLSSVLGLLLVSTLNRQARRGGCVGMSYDRLLDSLNGIRLVAVGKKKGKQGREVVYQLEETDAVEKQLLAALDIEEFHRTRPEIGGVVVYE